MEVEYKFLYKDGVEESDIRSFVDALEANKEIRVSEIIFRDIATKYLDSITGSLRKEKIAVRDRLEFHNVDGSWHRRNILSFKWGGNAEGGLHARSEVEFELGNGPIPFDKLDPDIYRRFAEAEREGLEELFVTVVHRVIILVDHGMSTIEVSLDNGFYVKNEGIVGEEDRKISKLFAEADGNTTTMDILKQVHPSRKISEVEIEFREGNVDDLKYVADFLAKKFDLIPNDISKYQRGMELYF